VWWKLKVPDNINGNCSNDHDSEKQLGSGIVALGVLFFLHLLFGELIEDTDQLLHIDLGSNNVIGKAMDRDPKMVRSVLASAHSN
jgi:hypothetical protein